MSDHFEDNELHPRMVSAVFGHEESERLLLADFNRNKLPGAYLFMGQKGIGKASMAYRFARFLLATPMPGEDAGGLFGEALPPVLPESLDIDPEHPTARRVASGGHANLLVLERSVNEDTKKLRNEIVVEDARKIGAFLSKSAAEDGWRIVIIDQADEMNIAAANAILKWLEEPPERALFILIASNPGKLLPTIRSRCRAVTFRPPSPEVFSGIVSRLLGHISPEEAQYLYSLSGGAPGLAVTLHQSGAVTLFEELMKLYAEGAPPPVLEQFAEQATRGKKDRRFSDFAALLLAILAGIIRSSTHAPVGFPDESGRVFGLLAAKKPLDYWLQLWEKCAPLLAQAESMHLDTRVVAAGVVTALAGSDGLINYMNNEM